MAHWGTSAKHRFTTTCAVTIAYIFIFQFVYEGVRCIVVQILKTGRGTKQITHFSNGASNTANRPVLRATQTGQLSQTEPQYVLRKRLVLYSNVSLYVVVSLSILTVYACLLLFRCLRDWREKVTLNYG